MKRNPDLTSSKTNQGSSSDKIPANLSPRSFTLHTKLRPFLRFPDLCLFSSGHVVWVLASTGNGNTMREKK